MSAVFINEGLIFIIIGIIGIIDGFRLNRISLAANEAYGPGLYLIILSVLMFIGGVYYIASSFRDTSKKTETAHFKIGPASLAITAMLMYSVIVSYVGYFLSTAVFTLVTIRLFGEKSLIKSTLIAIAVAVSFWLVFVNIAGIPLP